MNKKQKQITSLGIAISSLALVATVFSTVAWYEGASYLEVNNIGIKIDKTPSNLFFSKKISRNILLLTQGFEEQQAETIIELFDNIEKLDLQVDIAEAQNIFYARIFKKFDDVIQDINKHSSQEKRNFVSSLLEIGKRLNINVEFYQNQFDKAIMSD